MTNKMLAQLQCIRHRAICSVLGWRQTMQKIFNSNFPLKMPSSDNICIYKVLETF